VTYTQGPWRHDREGARIVSETVFYDYSNEDDEPEPVSVVSLFGAMGGDDNVADARLIAAAPELVEALRDAAHRIDDMLQCDDGQAWSEARQSAARFRALLARIEGDEA